MQDLDFALSKYTENGILDTAFGINGKVITDINEESNYGNDIIIQDDEKIIMIGTGNSDYTIARYNENGTLDDSFGENGIITTDIAGHFESPQSIIFQPDGKFIIAGSTYNGVDNDFSVIRYNTDGLLDISFGINGITTTDFDDAFNYANSLALQSDGKIVVTGYGNIDSYFKFNTARYNANGSLDSSFDFDGLTTFEIGSDVDICNSVAIQSDGKIILAGNSRTGGYFDIVLLRYLAIPVDITEQLNSSPLLISPNPASDILSIKGNLKNATVSLFSITGQLFYSESINSSDSHTIDISKFTPGTYFAEINNNGITLRIPIIII